MAEYARGPICAALVLKDGRRIRHVIVSASADIERVEDIEIKEESDLPFALGQVWDIDDDIER